MTGTHGLIKLALLIGIAPEFLCVICLIAKKAAPKFPLLVVYLSYLVVGELIGYEIYTRGTRSLYYHTFLLFAVADYILQLAVMWELASSFAKQLGQQVLRAVNIATIVCSAAFVVTAISLSTSLTYRDLGLTDALYLRVDLGFVVFRVLAFSAIIFLVRLLYVGAYSLGAYISAALSVYAAAALVSEVMHEWAMRLPYQYAHFAMIEYGRTAVWSAVMLAISWRVLISKDPVATSET